MRTKDRKGRLAMNTLFILIGYTIGHAVASWSFTMPLWGIIMSTLGVIFLVGCFVGDVLEG